MPNNFEFNDKENWTLKDAYISYTKDLQDLTVDQKLSKFHAFLIGQESPMVSEWLKSWGVFHRVTCQKEEQARTEKGLNDGNTGLPQSITITHSKNENFSFNGVVNNYTSGGKRSQEEELPDSQSKKSKSSATSDITSLNLSVVNPKINRNLSIWEVWESFLFDASTDDALFSYCPLKYGIITCGEGIMPHESMPVSDYEQLISTKDNQSNSFIMDFHEYIETVLDADTQLNMVKAARKLPDYTEEKRASSYYLQDMFTLFANVVYSPSTELTHSESVYNGKLIHPSFEALVTSIENDKLYFIHGEEPLKSMSHVMMHKSTVYDERTCYKADGVIRYKVDGEHDAELLLLETSSAYNQASNSKKGFDHHKSTFGLLAMLKCAADKWKKASFKTFSKLKVYFLHAYDGKMRLWSLHSPTPDIYILKREWSITVPKSFNKREPELLNYILHFNELKVKIKESMDIIDQVIKEHKYFTRKYRFELFPAEALLSSIINPTIVKLTEKKNSKGMYDQLPSSQPMN